MTLQGSFSPTDRKERINSMDIIRGIALLGISLMNITGFGLYNAYSDPTVTGGATGWNLNVWWINNMFFEGTMRGMFSMLFGAGIILFTNRSSENTLGISVTDLYFRRILWLFLFGMIHCYILLWHGEILYCYAITGMFAFSFRNWEPKNLIIGTVVLLSITMCLSIKDYFQTKSSFDAATEAQVKKDQGTVLTAPEAKSIEKWQEVVAQRKPSQEKIDEEIAAYQKGYFSVLMHKAPLNQFMQTTLMYRLFFLDAFAMMLLGMALLKSGILKAAKSNRYYGFMAMVAYTVGLTTNYFESDYLISHQFGIVPLDLVNISYDLGRVSTTIGHVAIIMLFIKSGWLQFLQKSLAGVGQMAFTNYIMQTIICNTIFLGFGFAMFGKLERYQLYYVVFGIWVFQIIISPIWLQYFRFGPLEWAWRSLTYWQKQPFRKTNT